MVEALLLFSEYNVWSLRLDRARKSWIHGTLLGSSFIIATIGISIKINSKSERSEEHFVSNHAILGKYLIYFYLFMKWKLSGN